MSDALKEILSMFKERAKSRFWPTFLIVFVSHNWEFFYVLFFVPYRENSNNSSLAMLKSISNNHISFLGVPIIVSIVLASLLPYIDALLAQIQHKALVLNKSAAVKVESESHNNSEEIRETIRQQIFSLETKKFRIKQSESYKLDFGDDDYQTVTSIQTISKYYSEILSKSDFEEMKTDFAAHTHFKKLNIQKIIDYVDFYKEDGPRFDNYYINTRHALFISSLSNMHEYFNKSNYKITPIVFKVPETDIAKIVNMLHMCIKEYANYNDALNKFNAGDTSDKKSNTTNPISSPESLN